MTKLGAKRIEVEKSAFSSPFIILIIKGKGRLRRVR
jgi:hypothetical protein